jgi:hypothetical protein
LARPQLQGGDFRRIHSCSVANGGDGFQRHVAPRDRPFIVLLQHQGADQAGDGSFVREDADHVGPSLDLLVQALQRIRGMDLRPVFLGEALVGQDVLLGAAHQVRELGMARFERVDQLGPVLLRCGERVLIEGGSERRYDDRAVLLADAGERVAHEVDAAALDGRSEHLGRGGLQPFVVVRDDQAGAAQAAIGEGAQELVPEDLGFTRLDGDAQNLASTVQIDRNGHYGGDADDPTDAANLDIRGIEPEVRPFPFERAVQERIDPFVDLAAKPRDLALRYPGHAHRLDQIVHGSCRETLDISLLNDRRHGLFRRPAGLKELGEVAALAQLRDLHVDLACARFPGPGPVPVAAVHTVVAALMRAGTAELIDIQRHETVGDEPEHLGQHVGVGRFRQKRAQGRGL